MTDAYNGQPPMPQPPPAPQYPQQTGQWQAHQQSGQPGQPGQPMQAPPQPQQSQPQQTQQTQQQQSQPTHTTQVTGQPRVIASRYRLHAELGRGGMGVVWRAEDTVIGRQVAVKELHLPEGSGDTAEEASVFQERVLREVRTGGKLNDPAVVTVYDVIGENSSTYIVMELVEAPTLSQVIKQNGPLPEQQVASIGEQVLSALEAAHNAGIVHRDVKPGNIMVAPNGRVKLTDFGIAQAIDDPRITTSGMLVGSPAFMSPERVAGHDALPASDLWALGASLYFAIEGKIAHERPTTAATLHAIMNEVPYLTRAQGPLAAAIMGLLIASPEGRITAPQARELLSIAARQQQAIQTPPGGQAATNAYTAYNAAWGNTGPTPKPASPNKRKLLQIGGAVAAVALLLGGFFLGKPIWAPSDSALAETFTYGEGGDVPSLAVGDTSYTCVNRPLQPGASLNETNWVDCEESHEAELFYVGRIAGGDGDTENPMFAAYPGEDVVERFGQAQCEADFHTSRYSEQERDELQYIVVVPTEKEWGKTSDVASGEEPWRQVYCFATRADGSSIPEQLYTDTW